MHTLNISAAVAAQIIDPAAGEGQPKKKGTVPKWKMKGLSEPLVTLVGPPVLPLLLLLFLWCPTFAVLPPVFQAD